MKPLDHIILIVSDHADQQVLFDTPVIVKKHHESIYECWAVKIHEGIWLMDEQGEWNELEEKDSNWALVVNSIYQRLKFMRLKEVA